MTLDTNIPVFKYITERYGSSLEDMEQIDKLYLIATVSNEMHYQGMGEPPPHIKIIEARIFSELDPHTNVIDLLKALVDSL
ncbi:MAG: hypothetical protein QNJ51_25830 [Calothrix sp. MO_167.B12]|nr:hypothetical protein [Calothrix sp. MO_167.B12]